MKDDFKAKKDTAHGAVDTVPPQMLASEEEIQVSRDKYSDSFAREKKRLKARKSKAYPEN